MTTIKDGFYKNGVGFTDPTDEITHELSFAEKEFNIEVPPDIMFAKCNGVMLKIDYAIEYDGEGFTVMVNGVEYKGVFTLSESYATPVILEKV